MRFNVKFTLGLEILFLICFSFGSLVAQESSKQKWMNNLKSKFNPYGSIRLGFGFAEEGELGISNNSPRIGLKFEHELGRGKGGQLTVIGRVEFGLNLASRDDTVEFSFDGEEGVAQIGDAVFTRIGYVGITYRDFSLIFGKNNSVYYTLVASEVDNFLAFGGNGLGVWNISDGGVSGTGRANQVIQLTFSKGGLNLGAQIQTRNISVNSKSIDTYGLGASYRIGGFMVGFGYNMVRDGIENPLPNQSKDGDEAMISVISFQCTRVKLALAYGVYKQHHRINDTFYDSKGIEFYSRYKFTTNRKWHAAAGFSLLMPDSGQNLGDFDTKFGILELGYAFVKRSSLYLSSKQDFSENVNGVYRGQSVYGLGIRYSF